MKLQETVHVICPRCGAPVGFSVEIHSVGTDSDGNFLRVYYPTSQSVQHKCKVLE